MQISYFYYKTHQKIKILKINLLSFGNLKKNITFADP